MKLDCYAVLGLSPAADDVVIRAAYLALMRRYHPDRDGSAEAAARARAITDAYSTIGNPDRRAEYDAGMRAHRYDILGYEEEAEVRSSPKGPGIPWPKAPVLATVAASALAIVLAVMVLPTLERGGGDTAPRQTNAPHAGKAMATEEAAAPVRTTAQKQPTALAAASAPPKTVETSPPAAPAVRTLPDKALAARSEPARAIENKPVPAKADVPPKPKRLAAASPPAAARTAPPKATAVDQKARAAALESWSASFYNQSVSNADDVRRSQLQLARDLFVKTRNACRSDSCVGDANASYISDISRIMTKPK